MLRLDGPELSVIELHVCKQFLGLLHILLLLGDRRLHLFALLFHLLKLLLCADELFPILGWRFMLLSYLTA